MALYGSVARETTPDVGTTPHRHLENAVIAAPTRNNLHLMPPIFEVQPDKLRPLSETTFQSASIAERSDLQRLLRDQIQVVADGVLIIAEEFGEWVDSRRRIDLLGIDRDANLVVFELKRTDDGGHMELQAIRYAAMVSTLTAEHTVEIFGNYLASRGRQDDPEQLLKEHLEIDEFNEDQFAQDVRIVLVSADFSREITTSVLWLNEKYLDIRCIRIKPYSDRGRTLIDVQQIIPLPEASAYQVQVREKRSKEQKSRNSTVDFTRYDVTVSGQIHKNQWKRNAILIVVKALISSGVPISTLVEFFKARGRKAAFYSIPQEVDSIGEFLALAEEDPESTDSAFRPSRFHTRDSDLIHSEGRTWVFTNQWGTGWPNVMRDLRGSFPRIQLEYLPCLQEE